MLSKSSVRNLCQSFSHSSGSFGFFSTLQHFLKCTGTIYSYQYKQICKTRKTGGREGKSEKNSGEKKITQEITQERGMHAPQEHSKNSEINTENPKTRILKLPLYAAVAISQERTLECSQAFFLFQDTNEMDSRKQGPRCSLLLQATLCPSYKTTLEHHFICFQGL